VWTNLLLSGVVLAVLTVSSYLFNDYIDRTPTSIDGITAYRVAGGVGYTLVGISAVVGIWSTWENAATVFAIALTCFIASGIPMIQGDLNRSHRNRSRS
jgi:hypothetical protein